jgi:pimeloyl-ACP methyl ester carboxylesterase
MTIRRRSTALAVFAILLCLSQPRTAASQASSPLECITVKADDGHALTVWAKHPQYRARGAILLLHGRTWSALPNFDLHVDGKSASTMDALAASGYAVYALDQRGYGATARDSSGWLTPKRAARDASEVLAWIHDRDVASDRSARLPALFGYSRGSLTAALAAQTYPERMSAVILYGFPLRPKFYAALGADPAVPLRAHTTLADAATDFITPGSVSPQIEAAYRHAAVTADPIRVEWKDEREFAALDPHAIHIPIMLLNGERDPNVINSSDAEFFAQLANVDRAWVVLVNSDHVAHLERPKDFVYAITAFLWQPVTH